MDPPHFNPTCPLEPFGTCTKYTFSTGLAGETVVVDVQQLARQG